MASRLSSLLVRDGLVGVKKMEAVFQRQVVYGGAIDSILLEMKLVPEERLIQYLSLANGLPPATIEETNHFDPAAVKRCPEDVARTYGVAPLAVEGDALRVLVRDPVDLARLEELADELDIPIQPLVVPEYRFHVVFDRAFGRQTEARFAALARAAAEVTPAQPVGKPKTVIIEAHRGEEHDRQVVDVAVPPSTKPHTRTLEFSTGALARELEKSEQARRKLEAERHPTAPPAIPATDDRPTERDLPAQPEPGPAPADQRGVPTVSFVSAETPLPGAVAVATPRTEPPDVEVTPMSVGEARVALAAADNRDDIFAILLRAVRSRAWYAGLLTIQGRAAIGRIAIVGDQFDRNSIASVLIPVDDARAFNTAVSSGAPYIGPVATGDGEIDEMIRRMGGVVPPAVLLLPIAIKTRVVAVVIGHRGADTLGVAEVSELLPLAGSAADALSRIIVKSKSVGYRAPEAAASAPLPIDDLPTRKHEKARDGWAQPSGASRPDLDLGSDEVTVGSDQATPIQELLDIIEGGDPDAIESVTPEALSRPDEVLDALAGRFPGRLHVERFENVGRPLRAAAVEALAGYPARELEQGMESVRHALHAEDPKRIQAAASGVAELADVKAIPDLLDALQREDEGSPHARRALVALTKQDFGNSVRKWRAWWDKNRGHHRIEWLIEGLASKDEPIRKSSIEDLRRLTGEYFGYHFDLPRKDREASRERWLQWWNEVGRRRFLRADFDERHRPTAVLPVRRDQS